MSMSYAFQTVALYIVLEYCSGASSSSTSRFRKFPEHVARFYAAELALAIEFLHGQGVIYRDMKPENVLLDSEGHVKLGDFGLAKDNIGDRQGAKSICGTPEYMAPEVLNKGVRAQRGLVGPGDILYEMLTGLPPGTPRTGKALPAPALRAAAHPADHVCGVRLGSVGLFCRDPAERLGANGADAIKAHPFFNPKQSSSSSSAAAAAAAAAGSASSSSANPFPRAAPSSDGFNWPELEARQMKPPIDPMEGIEMSADDRDNTANFDPQFTNLEIESDIEGSMDQEQFEHFDGFFVVNDSDSDEDLPGDGDDGSGDGANWERFAHGVAVQTRHGRGDRRGCVGEEGDDAGGAQKGEGGGGERGRRVHRPEAHGRRGHGRADPQALLGEQPEPCLGRQQQPPHLHGQPRAPAAAPRPPPPRRRARDSARGGVAEGGGGGASASSKPVSPPSEAGRRLPTRLVHSSKPNGPPADLGPDAEFVAYKICGAQVEQSMDAIENHVLHIAHGIVSIDRSLLLLLLLKIEDHNCYNYHERGRSLLPHPPFSLLREARAEEARASLYFPFVVIGLCFCSCLSLNNAMLSAVTAIWHYNLMILF